MATARGNQGKCSTLSLSFLFSGFWHGASWNFVIWGLLNGLLVVLNHNRLCIIKHKLLSRIAIFSYFSFTLIFFRSETFADAIVLLKSLFSPNGFSYLLEMAQALSTPELYLLTELAGLFSPQLVPLIYLSALFLLTAISTYLLTLKNAHELTLTTQYNKGFALYLSLLFYWCTISLSGISTFLYFNF